MRRAFRKAVPVNRRESNSNPSVVLSPIIPRRGHFASARKSQLFTSTPNNNVREIPNEWKAPNDEPHEKISNVLTNKSMHLFQVSPLYRFKFEKHFLKRVARNITMYIQKEALWGENEEVRVPGSRIVNITPVVDDKDNVYAGIVITVEEVPESEDDDEETEKKYDFWGLLCRRLDSQITSESMVDSPVMLVKGNVSLTNLILSYFSKQFDCCIRETKISPINLMWLGAMWSGYPADVPARHLKLKYKVPEDAGGIKTVRITIDRSNAIDLWKSVHDRTTDLFLNEEKETFAKGIEAHILKCFKMDLQCMTLIEIETTSVYAHHLGKIKLFSPKTCYEVIKYFMLLADPKQF